MEIESTTVMASERAGERKNEGEGVTGGVVILPTPDFFAGFLCLAGRLWEGNWSFEVSGVGEEEGCGDEEGGGLRKQMGRGADLINGGSFPIPVSGDEAVAASMERTKLNKV